jgi:deazaflavin-dependent oxidoreductase (nitroreductase family)
MTVDTAREKPSPNVPHWLIRSIWFVHRRAYAISGGRFGLRTPAERRWGTLRLHTIGRQSGRERIAIVGYIEDGPNILVAAMNGWMHPEPAWWLNLQANPAATIELPNGEVRAVTASAAPAGERERLWQRFVDLGTAAFTHANAAARARETSIVILAPTASQAGSS